MDKDDLIRHCERKLKLRALQEFDDDGEDIEGLEREFALAALDLVRRQPAMEDLARANRR